MRAVVPAWVLAGTHGVRKAEVKLETEEARVVYDDAKQMPEKLPRAIDRLGFRATVVSHTRLREGP